ncbi:MULTISPECIES: LytR C-terminal domain-containing protein [Arthrobacter]|uniref:LytR family transcriptional regulator n=1 Tax=Arthrobacter terricola TaxID=2547396 RepID=A0A4R5KT74_9MICC|nr:MULTISPECIES: LytR C-terminal domain-containing protein [Arthrobacter]MBT8159874.1 LytR C-terminal domain-containing protein [Arthrobacter sp. GN70]TDF99041.1 LytR family transcriptional regulator [Arthrobacter terricola]
MTKYARDEFDRVPQSSSRQGVHRLVASASRPVLWPVLVMGGIALAVGLVAFLILPKLGAAPTVVPQAVAAADATKAAAAPSASASPSASTAPQPSSEPSPSTTPSSTPTPTTAPVDMTAAVAVYNGTTTSGLAARVAGLVQGNGWPLSTVANWGGMPQQTSSVFYKGEAQKGNAEALGKLLGIANLVDSAEFQQPVVVILGPGYR